MDNNTSFVSREPLNINVPPTPPPPHHSGNKLILVLVVLCLLAGAFYAGLWFSTKTGMEDGLRCPPFENCEAIPGETVDWRTYRNAQYAFELSYPEDELLLNTASELQVLSLYDNVDRQRFNFALYVDHPGIGFEGMNVISNSMIVIDSITVRKQIMESAGGHEQGMQTSLYTFSKNGHEFMIVSNGPNERTEQILSTLKFTN